jgi:hypothetical protein
VRHASSRRSLARRLSDGPLSSVLALTAIDPAPALGREAKELAMITRSNDRRFSPSIGTEISSVRFQATGRTSARQRHSFSALLRQGSSLGHAMNQLWKPRCHTPLIAFVTLLANNLAWISNLFFDWW